jgi:hypothetical protein
MSDSKIESAIRIAKEKGFKQLLIKSYAALVRPYLPTVGYKKRAKALSHDRVTVDMDEKFLDSIVPLNHPYNTETNIELGLRLAHTAVTQTGDHVVIIGGGNGISATTAANNVGPDGKVSIYDGMTGEEHHRFGVTHILKSLELNGVGDRCEAYHGLVGTKDDTVEMYSEYMKYDVPLIHPEDLPECDILEFDCNGMELTILKNLEIRPRAMIIEVEAPFYKQLYGGEKNPRGVFDELNRLGYTIIQQFGHEGKTMSFEQLLDLIDREYETGEKQQVNDGAKDSPIVIALRDDYVA